MCEDCGCGDPKLVPVDVHARILASNDHQAQHNRDHFVEAGVLAINLMGSPGSGKTALLEATARVSRGLKLCAVSGDLATDNDARRLNLAGIPSEAITTGNACHLDADMVHASLHHLKWRESDVFIIENVGNLVCPAVYDLGQAFNVVALAVTEGEDKPLKYPTMFRGADLVVLTKLDLVPHLDFSLPALEDALGRVMPEPKLLKVSAKSGEGIEAWVSWLRERQPARLAGHGHGHEHGHSHPHGHGRHHA
ncbi:MAG: hydrogenase nickel incorporation protein HypB [Archangiaceae bacterium]|nr:hydrogenase nickel incorporation protein HypB [Archangiaceae bacterium]